jgi:cytidylate kinase
VYLDSTALSIEEVIESILKTVRSRLTNGREYR